MNRMLSLLFLLFAGTGLCFGQGATHVFIWADGITPGWLPLTYQCSNPGITLLDGVTIEVWLDSDLSSFNPELPAHTPENDRQPVIGSSPTQVNYNSFSLNSGEIGYPPGSFSNVTNPLTYAGTMPSETVFYLLIRCPDGNPIYESAPMFLYPGYQEYMPQAMTNPVERPAWSCLDPCDPPDDLSYALMSPYDGFARITWVQAGESDLDHYEILRDGEAVYAVDAGAGGYEWDDTDLTNCRIYDYELVSVSIDGTREVLANREVRPLEGLEEISGYRVYRNFPNPTDHYTMLMIDLAEDQTVSAGIYDMNGVLVEALEESALLRGGRHVLRSDHPHLANGFYEYRVAIGTVLLENGFFLKNSPSPREFAAPNATTDSTGGFMIDRLHTDQIIFQRNECFEDLGETTVRMVEVSASGTGYQPADTLLDVSGNQQHNIQMILRNP